MVVTAYGCDDVLNPVHVSAWQAGYTKRGESLWAGVCDCALWPICSSVVSSALSFTFGKVCLGKGLFKN